MGGDGIAMSKIKVKALQPLVDYKTGVHYQTGDEFELERSEQEIITSLAHGLYIISEEEVEDGKVFSDGADA